MGRTVHVRVRCASIPACLPCCCSPAAADAAAGADGTWPRFQPRRPGGGALPSGEMPHSRVVEADPDLVIVAPCGLDLDTTRREVQEQLAHEDWWWVAMAFLLLRCTCSAVCSKEGGNTPGKGRSAQLRVGGG